MVKMSYHPTTSKYAGKTKTYYIIYEEIHMHNYRGHRKQRTQKRAKRVYISGKLLKTEIGTFRNRFGRSVYGVRFTYKNPVKGAIAHRKHTTYHMPRKEATVKKIVEVPRHAKHIRVTTRAPKDVLMDID